MDLQYQMENVVKIRQKKKTEMYQQIKKNNFLSSDIYLYRNVI